MTLLEALQSAESRVGDVIAPRLREIATGRASDRIRAALIHHCPEHGQEILDLTPADATALLTSMGRTALGRPLKEEPRAHTVEVKLTAAELAALDAARGAEPRAVYLRRMAGLGAWVAATLDAPPKGGS